MGLGTRATHRLHWEKYGGDLYDTHHGDMSGVYPSSSVVAVGCLVGVSLLSLMYCIYRNYIMVGGDPKEEDELYGARVDAAALHAGSEA